MAKVYWNTDTGNDTTGDGSSGNKYATFDKAYDNSVAGDFLDGGGSITSTSAKTAITNRTIIQDLSVATGTYKLTFTATSCNASSLIVIGFDLETSAIMSISGTYSKGFQIYNSKWKRIGDSSWINVTGSSRAQGSIIMNCDLDFTDLTTFGFFAAGTNSIGGSLLNCNLKNINRTSGSLFSGIRPTLLSRCTFPDVAGSGSICKFETLATMNSVSIQHCSFTMISNNISILDNSATDGAFNFNGNVVEGNGLTYNALIGSNLNPVDGIIGNNLFHDCTTNSTYDDERSLTDYTDTVDVFKSYVVGNADWFVPVDTSNGKNADSLAPNMDLGAYQGTAVTDYPVVGDVLLGVDYSFGTLTGTLALPTPPNDYDLREGVIVGAVTGILKVPTISQVEDGVEFDRTDTPLTGTQTPLAPQQGPLTVTVYTSNGSNISGTTASPTTTVEVESGTLVNTVLSDLGATETFETGTTLVRNASNSRRLDIRIDR